MRDNPRVMTRVRTFAGLGDIRGLFVDDRDHLWVIHMPSSLTPQEVGAAVKPPIADCSIPGPTSSSSPTATSTSVCGLRRRDRQVQAA